MREVREDVRSIRAETLTTRVFEIAQEATTRRFEAIERDQTEWTTESRGEHVRLEAKISAQNVDFRAMLDSYREKQEALERAQRESRGRNIFAIALAFLGIAGTIISAVVLKGLGV